jgi:oligopeptide/dipeptide ABC transporter ATP-binding protein
VTGCAASPIRWNKGERMMTTVREADFGPLIRVEDLSVIFPTRDASVQALDTVSLEIGRRERIGIVGESGSGKSTLALAMAGHIRGNQAQASGRVVAAGLDLFAAQASELQSYRQNRLGFVFQNPIGTLDPTRRISRQFYDNGRPLPVERIATLLQSVGLTDTARVLNSYPHELSGGMAQRVAIAMAIKHRPEIIIADEPTSALDASIRSQILRLLEEVSEETGAALILVSHDLRAVRSHCDRVAVMYAGRIVEEGRAADIFQNPLHPYTIALLAAMPGAEGYGGAIRPIPGNPPLMTARASSCAFADRCSKVRDDCRSLRPETDSWGGRRVVCHLAAAGQRMGLAR